MVLVISALRRRYSWWPLHPVFFLVFGARTTGALSASFLLGWAIKVAVIGIGGVKSYKQGKKLMTGVIAGDLLGGLVFMVAGWVFY